MLTQILTNANIILTNLNKTFLLNQSTHGHFCLTVKIDNTSNYINRIAMIYKNINHGGTNKMNTKDLSVAGVMCLGQIIYSGLNQAIENDTINNETLKELLNWYKDNIIISYDYLKEKFDKVQGDI